MLIEIIAISKTNVKIFETIKVIIIVNSIINITITKMMMILLNIRLIQSF